MTPPAIAPSGVQVAATGLTKIFRSRHGGAVTAVDDVGFTAGPGETLGLLGRNGAGKTTTMRILTTVLHPTAGTATVCGHDLRDDPAAVRRLIGYVPQGGSTRPAAAIGAEAVLQARLYGLDRRTAASRVAALLDEFGLAPLAARPAMTLSGGQRRRVDLVLALLHEPRVLILDEPTAALDPPSRTAVWAHLRRLRDERGITVLVSTHNLDEADRICDRVLIMDDGRVLAEDTPDRLKARLATATAPTLDDVFLAITAGDRPGGE